MLAALAEAAVLEKGFAGLMTHVPVPQAISLFIRNSSD